MKTQEESVELVGKIERRAQICIVSAIVWVIYNEAVLVNIVWLQTFRDYSKEITLETQIHLFAERNHILSLDTVVSPLILPETTRVYVLLCLSKKKSEIQRLQVLINSVFLGMVTLLIVLMDIKVN